MIRRLSWLVLFLAAAAALAALAGLRSYRAFTQEELVATVQCEPAPPESGYRFRLAVAHANAGRPAPLERFDMQGDQWSVSGEFLKWAPWLTAMGAKPLHKLTRLSSRYLSTREEVSAPRTAYDLSGGGTPVWRWLRRVGPWLPLVDAVYGSSAYMDARSGDSWGVYVTHSGYLIRPRR